jgi:hypothetical protein
MTHGDIPEDKQHIGKLEEKAFDVERGDIRRANAPHRAADEAVPHD